MINPFDILAGEYRPMVLAYLRAMVSDAHLAEDLAQETMIAAFKSFGEFEPSGNFGRWLRGIARNTALMHWRSEGRKSPMHDLRVLGGIEEVFEGFDRDPAEMDWWETRKLTLRDCVTHLSDHLKAAIESVYFSGKTLDETAGALNSTRAAVGQRLCRARNLIRECMDRKLQLRGRHV